MSKSNENIDYLIVGAGLYGAVIARILTDNGYKCFIIDKRNHIGGNVYTERKHNIDVHMYGPHIFHTNNPKIWDFVQKYMLWDSYQLNTIAFDGKKIYHLPFNMNTYYDIFGVTTPEEAYDIIHKEISLYGVDHPTNLEEQAICMVGKTIYEILIKNYTEKQWNKKCTELSPDIIKRLPLRMSFNNNYFNDSYQGIPRFGYTKFIENLINDIPYILNIDFNYEFYKSRIRKAIIYCGAVDELLDYEIGCLEWRSLRFEEIEYQYNGHNGQGTAIKNLVGQKDIMPATRIVEHMWFKPSSICPLLDNKTITSIQTIEYPENWTIGKERYYPINNDDNERLYDDYCKLLKKRMPNVILGGRLGKYRYFDMDDTINEAMNDAEKLMKNDI